VNKVNVTDPNKVDEVIRVAHGLNPNSKILCMKSEVFLDEPEFVRGKRVLVIEDGPTMTHGELMKGAFISKSLGAILLILSLMLRLSQESI